MSCVFLKSVPLCSSKHFPFILKTTQKFTRNVSYNAAVLKEYGKPLVLEAQKKQKKLQKNQVRVAVHCCGLNISDLLITKKEYDVCPPTPFIPGYEISGRVMEVHDSCQKDGLEVGNRIVALNKDSFGGFAEECIVSIQDVWKLPDGISFQIGAALLDGYSTALLSLARRTHLKQGDYVLVAAGAGGLGLAAVDVAANVYQAKVIAVCGTEDKASLVRERGAWSALSYHPDHMLKTVKDVTDGKGVDVVFEAMGGKVFPSSLKCVAHEGTIILADYAGRHITELKVSDIVPTSCEVLSMSLRNYRASNIPVYRQIVQDAIDMCEQGLVSPCIQEDFDLEKINMALRHLEENRSTAKIVIDILDDD